jgi:hypothetical protein
MVGWMNGKEFESGRELIRDGIPALGLRKNNENRGPKIDSKGAVPEFKPGYRIERKIKSCFINCQFIFN